MVSRFAGALLRAVLVGVLFALPVFVVPDIAVNDGMTVTVVSICMFLWCFSEYFSASPSLIEFRDAPPFNRIRFASLFVIVYSLALIQAHADAPTTATRLVHNIGAIIGYSIDLPGSPVNLMAMQFPTVTSDMSFTAFLASAGISYLTSLLALLVFMAVFFLKNWPSNSGPFNVWINLPTFDPTSAGDVIERINRDARINIVLGFVLPFLIPAVIGVLFRFVGVSPFDSPYLMIWVIAGWAFLPTGMIMRGIALSRVAHLATETQKRLTEEQHGNSVSAFG